MFEPSRGLEGWAIAAVAAVLVLAGCGGAEPTRTLGGTGSPAEPSTDAGPTPDAAMPRDAGPGPAPDAGVAPCFDLGAGACADRADCIPKTCESCPGAPAVDLCYAAALPEIACPDIACPVPACAELTADACSARSDCAVQVCSLCTEISERCVDADNIPSCPRPSCQCSRLDEDACIAASGCHALYVDSTHLCDCVGPDCHCAEFNACVDGPAQCSPPVGGPFCTVEPPICEADFLTVGYVPGCYEGCVRLDECVF